MRDHDLEMAAAAGVEALLVAILAAPAVAHFATKTRLLKARNGYESISGFYEDGDGEATEESTQKYSDLPSRVAAWLSSALGLGAAIASAVLSQHATPSSGGASAASLFFIIWSDVIAWGLIFLQCVFLPRRGDYTAKFHLANYALVCSVFVLASLIFRSKLDDILESAHDSPRMAQGLCWLLQVFSAIVAFFALGTVPRRPDVYSKGSLVDQQYTVSLLSKISFSWNSVIFDISKKRQLQMEDLPKLDHLTRSENLHNMFASQKTEGRLWWKLLKFLWIELAQQWGLVFISAVLALFPQFMMYNLLQKLEQPSTPESGISGTLAWALALCLSLALDNIVGSVLSWWTNSRLVIPLQAVLQTLVFQKAMNEHETAMPPPKQEAEAEDDTGKDADAKKDKNVDDKPKIQEKKDEVRQSVINHMKLDSGRVTMFCGFNYYLPLAVVKLILAGGFLMTLLGWKAVVAGLASASLVIPLNTLISKKYAKIQFGLMKYRDGKAHLLTEALQGMRQIKYSALEQHWEQKILSSRNEELAQYWKASLFMAAVILVMNMGPLLLACVAQSVYAWEQGGNIRASVIFASLGLFDQLDEATALLPLLQVYMMEAWTSCVRLEKYFSQPDKEPVAVPGDVITFENATVAWPKKEDPDKEGSNEEVEERSMLRDVSLQFPEGKLSVITGNTGAGKSLLLAAILGEVKLITGTVKVPTPPPEETLEAVKPIPSATWLIPSLTSFVSQSPWIESGTVQDNITFGLPLVDSRYHKVLRACSLEKDLELLANGDKAEVGPKGITLSGGQKWRVALARALYSRAGIIILDDVLSAVDAHVGRSMVDNALTGELAEGRTRILATHHADLCLPKASYLVRLHEGKVESAEAITPHELVTASSSGSKGSSVNEASEAQTLVDSDQMSSAGTTAAPAETPENSKTAKNDEDEEKREKGRVKWKVYKTYLEASKSPLLWTIVVLFIIGSGVASIGRVYSFKELTDDNSTEEVNNFSASSHYGSSGFFVQNPERGMMYAEMLPHKVPFYATVAQGHSAMFWIGMSVVFYVVMVLTMVARSLTMTAIGLRTSKILFERMTHAILRAPLKWVDTNPSGRILNRFTSDMFLVDRRLPGDLGNFIQSIFQLIVTIAASLSVSVYVILAGIVLMAVYARVASVYIHVAREVKRLNSISNSPIFDQFGSVLSGLATIRAFHRTQFYMNRMFNLIDNSNKASWAQNLSGRWMSFRLSMIGTLFVTVVAVIAVSGHVDAALAGFSLTFALRYSYRLTGLLSSMTSIELSFNATERVVEYSEIEIEPEGGRDVPAAWPAQGKIEVENLSVAYKDSLPPVLKNLNFTVKAGERIGIIGRTGAGKSTLASVFFRLLKPREGLVRIDDIDIAEVKLIDLRSRLAIIPQDPFLFSGSLRSNLDMEGIRDDYEIRTTLQRVHLAKEYTASGSQTPQHPAVASHQETVVSTSEAVENIIDSQAPTSLPGVANLDTAPSATTVTITEPESEPSDTDIFNNLSMEISTGGGNLSQGQRQLVCLARALLARPKIVIMDEATSAVDRATDTAIQSSLRDAFAAEGCTVLVIAHRLSTVADFDKILVLDKGRMAEMGSPRELLERGMARDEERKNGGDTPGKKADVGDAAQEGAEGEVDGTGAFWDLVQSSAEKDKLMDMILGDHQSS